MKGHFLVSYPRSGHHMTERMIRHVFSLQNFDYSYCEFYKCCHTLPCRVGSVLQKNHDFDLQLPTDLGQYVVLYRDNPIRQSDALFRYYSAKKYGRYGHVVKKDTDWWKSEQYRNVLINRIQSDASRHREFRQKWVRNAPANVLPIEYYDLVLQPRIKLRQILEHLFRGFGFEEAIIERAIEVERPRLINVIPDDFYESIKRQLRTTEFEMDQ